MIRKKGRNDGYQKNLDDIRKTLKEGVLLLAVTKTHTVEEINEAIDHGVTDIGENKAQEILEKYDRVKPVRWHMIGHLQTNKVKNIIDKVDLIHSVDSIKLAREISKRAIEHDRIMDILIQVNVAGEESKFGVSPDEVEDLIKEILESCPGIIIKGIMTVAPFDENPDNVSGVFAKTKEIYDKYAKIDNKNLKFEYLSMGMTHDYQVAIEEGSNMIRVGTGIFGKRVY